MKGQSGNLQIFKLNDKKNIAFQTLETVKHTTQKEFKYLEKFKFFFLKSKIKN